ncbi:hypothetical protein [Roseofilum capinflatum]
MPTTSAGGKGNDLISGGAGNDLVAFNPGSKRSLLLV